MIYYNAIQRARAKFSIAFRFYQTPCSPNLQIQYSYYLHDSNKENHRYRYLDITLPVPMYLSTFELKLYHYSSAYIESPDFILFNSASIHPFTLYSGELVITHLNEKTIKYEDFY